MNILCTLKARENPYGNDRRYCESVRTILLMWFPMLLFLINLRYDGIERARARDRGIHVVRVAVVWVKLQIVSARQYIFSDARPISISPTSRHRVEYRGRAMRPRKHLGGVPPEPSLPFCSPLFEMEKLCSGVYLGTYRISLVVRQGGETVIATE